MSSLRRVARNVAYNWTGFAVQIAVAFFLTPFVIHKLGDARYGVWALTVSLTGYYGLLDLGFRAGLTQYITRALAVGDQLQVNKTVSSGFAALACCAGMLLCASLGLAFWSPSFINMSPEIAHEVFWCILIVGASVAVQFFFFPFSAVLTATQRFDIANLIGIGIRLLTAIATLVVLARGGGLVGLSIVTATGNILDYAARCVSAFQVLPALRVKPHLVGWSVCRALLSFGLWNVLIAASARLISYTDALVITAFMPIAAVAWFAIAANLVHQFSSIFIPIGQVFYPLIASLDAKKDQAELKRAYLTGTRLVAVVACAVAVIAGVFAPEFFRLWIGPRFVENSEFHSIPLIFRLLLVAAVASSVQRIGYQAFIATGRVRQLAALLLCEAVFNLGLSLILIRSIGLLGVAFGTLVPAVTFQFVILPLVLHKQIGVRMAEYARLVLLRMLVIAALLLALFQTYTNVFEIDDWPDLMVAGMLSTAAAMSIVLMFGCEHSERLAVISQIRSFCRTARRRLANA